MLFDWFTVMAQMINFLILAWLLKRFLYKPILSAVDKREAFIVAQLEDSKAKLAQAEALKNQFESEQMAFEKQKTDVYNQAVAEAETTKLELEENARKAFDVQRTKQKAQLVEEETHFKTTMAQRAKQEVFKVAQKAISDLASDLLEAQMVAELIRRLHALPPKEKAFLIHGIEASDAHMLIRSTLEIPETQRIELLKTLKVVLGRDVFCEYAIKPDLICGIELMTDGYKLSWNIEDYLGQLEKNADAKAKKAGEALVG